MSQGRITWDRPPAVDSSLDAPFPYSVPVQGNADGFVLITAQTRSGLFADVHYDGAPLSASIGPDSNGSFRSHQGGGIFRNITYTSTTVEFQNLAALAGDADGDKDVDITDFNVLATNFDPGGANSATNDWITADFDEDGDVDITDFNGLANNFAPGGYGGTNTIPEPSAVVLFSLGCICIMCRRGMGPKPI